MLDAGRIIDDWQDGEISNEDFGKLYKEVSTLKRGAKVAGLNAIVELCSALENCYQTIHDSSAPPVSGFIASIKQGHDGLIQRQDVLGGIIHDYYRKAA